MTREEYGKWYREVYLQSPHWRSLRNWVLLECCGLCQRCRRNLADDVHHTKKAYKDLWHENPGDLRALCRDCHRYVHGYSDYDPLAPAPKANLCENIEAATITRDEPELTAEEIDDRKWETVEFWSWLKTMRTPKPASQPGEPHPEHPSKVRMCGSCHEREALYRASYAAGEIWLCVRCHERKH